MAEPLSVASLHALVYCERLFYLEEVEHIRVADAAVFAGRALHARAVRVDPADGVVQELELKAPAIGLQGRVDALRTRGGEWIPIERKRGRAARDEGKPAAWNTDRIQLAAYALVIEEAAGVSVREGRVLYAADNASVVVAIDGELRADVARAIERARELGASVERPPITENERLCARCSLASACLPEEVRAAAEERRAPRLLPAHPDRLTLHVLEHGARVGTAGLQIEARRPDGSVTAYPIAEVGNVVVHGNAQVTTQALRLCADHDVGVQWLTASGRVVGAFAPPASSAQRQLRQFRALDDQAFALSLAKRVVTAKLQGQLRFVLRATRGTARAHEIEVALGQIRQVLRRVEPAEGREALLGIEGAGSAAYFDTFETLIDPELDPKLHFAHRSRRPATDRASALLNFLYALLYREVLAAIVSVGLHAGLGFYHQPRSAAHTLVLDLMELFRVPLVDMPAIGALNRRTFDVHRDFVEASGAMFLSSSGRASAIALFERRRHETWRHDRLGYSLSYARLVELEVRLLEKEWIGEGGLFATLRIR